MTFDSDRTGQAFGLVLAAAGATALGCLAVFFPSLAKFATAKVLGASLGFATGVMLYVSLVEIYGKAQDGFEDAGHSEDDAFIYTTLTFFGGILGMKGIDVIIHMITGGATDYLENAMEVMVTRNENNALSSECVE